MVSKEQSCFNVPIFHDEEGKYEILKKLGDGMTSNVYLARDHNNKEIALKLLKEKFLKRIDSKTSVEQEIQTL